MLVMLEGKKDTNFAEGGSTKEKLWIKTGKGKPKKFGTFKDLAKKKKTTIKKLGKKILAEKNTRQDFIKGTKPYSKERREANYEWERFKNSKQGIKKMKEREQAQMVKNMGVFADGGKVMDKKEFNKQLKEGKLFYFINFEDGYQAEVGYRDFFNEMTYYIFFNGKMIKSSKTFNAIFNKLKQLVEDWNLKYNGESQDADDYDEYEHLTFKDNFAKGGSMGEKGRYRSFSSRTNDYERL